MTSLALWILFGVPLAAAVFAWVGLCKNWNTDHHRFSKVSVTLLATAAVVLACGGLVYVHLVRPMPSGDYVIESWGLLLSLLGIVTGLVALCFPRWFSVVSLGVSAWMFVLFALMASTI
jgi:hypothetical protein